MTEFTSKYNYESIRSSQGAPRFTKEVSPDLKAEESKMILQSACRFFQNAALSKSDKKVYLCGRMPKDDNTETLMPREQTFEAEDS